MQYRCVFYTYIFTSVYEASTGAVSSAYIKTPTKMSNKPLALDWDAKKEKIIIYNKVQDKLECINPLRSVHWLPLKKPQYLLRVVSGTQFNQTKWPNLVFL